MLRRIFFHKKVHPQQIKMKTKNLKSKWNFGRLAAITVLAGSCVGPLTQKSSAVLDPPGNYYALKNGDLLQIVNVQNNEEIHAGSGVGAEVYQQNRIGDYWKFTQNSDGTWLIVSIDTTWRWTTAIRPPTTRT